MLYRPNAVAFLVPNGHDNLSQEVKALLFSVRHAKADYCPNYREDENYNDEPVLWIDVNDIDRVLQNSAFWDYLVDDTIKSYNNFKARILVESADNGIYSNDNSMICVYCYDSFVISNGSPYVSNKYFSENFVLTAEYVDSIPDIKQWIRDRGIEVSFDLRRSDDILKEGVKAKYGLLEEI